MNKDLIIKRLSIIKILYKIGIEQSKQSEMTSFFSILSFHDSVEMFLKLSAELKNIKDCQNFMGYWEKIPELTLKESMRNLNSKRVNIKHKGLIPGKADIESSRVNTTDFFNQNTKNIFGVDFSDISLLELIKFDKTKDYLIDAKKLLDKSDFKSCVQEISKGFYELLKEYKDSKGESFYSTPFDLTERVSFRNSGWGDEKTAIDNKLKDTFNIVNENFKNIEKAIEVISLGLNYKKYIKFKLLTPKFYITSQNEYVFYSDKVKNWSKENCNFMIDFVLDSAFTLQEFDFNYSDLKIEPEVQITIKTNIQ